MPSVALIVSGGDAAFSPISAERPFLRPLARLERDTRLSDYLPLLDGVSCYMTELRTQTAGGKGVLSKFADIRVRGFLSAA